MSRFAKRRCPYFESTCLVTYSSFSINEDISSGSSFVVFGGGEVVEGRRVCPPSDGGDFGIPVSQPSGACLSDGIGGGSGPKGLQLEGRAPSSIF